MRKRCTIRIELLSDMCVSDGSSYNSLLDTDICSDRYGFPYIPAKRIRGCLRECAIELSDWGDSIDTNTLFGDKGDSDSRAKLRIGDALPENYEQNKDFVLSNEGHILVHPQNVLNSFSYIRTQTSIDYETGVADDKSLRTMRVADKGLVFLADAEVEDGYFDELARCCKVLRHMGIARTRGLGEVKVSLEAVSDGTEKCSADHAGLCDGADSLKYEIDLIEPVICKSVNGEESRTLDYIEGSKVLGLIAQDLTEDFIGFMDKGSLKCSNAYISKDGKRFTEVPGYIYKIKNDSGRYVNKLAENEENKKETEGRQLNQMKHRYVFFADGKLQTSEVMTEERYHHRRPDDKSIGRAAANESNDADFYQMDSISAGQKFAGTVTGSAEQIAEVYRILTQDKDFYIGYSRTSEYGKVRIRVTDTCKESVAPVIRTDSFTVNLNAPAILYNDKAMATTDPEILVAEILASLNIAEKPDNDNIDKFIRFTTLGGYNVTWNMRKPTIQAFDKGTALRFRFDEPVEIPEGGTILIGERTAEGYGEALVCSYSAEENPYIGQVLDDTDAEKVSTVDASSEFASRLAAPLLEAFIRKEAVEAAQETKMVESVYKPTVSNMIIMAKESSSLDEVRKAAIGRYSDKTSEKKKKKDEAAKTILNQAESADLLNKFSSETGITGLNVDSDRLQMMYLREYLTQLKYKMRGGEKK